MNIFIIGGGGVLGRHLGYHLTQHHHQVYILDLILDDINRTIIDQSHLYRMSRYYNFGDLQQYIRSKNPHIVFHLAETSTIDMYDNINAVHDNIGLTSDILHICARYNIRGIIGTWEPIDNRNDSVLIYSLQQKSELIKYFHKGNTVVNEVRIPQLVHPDYPSVKYGAILNRLFYHHIHNEPFYIGNENELYTGSRSYNTIEPTIKQLTAIMQRNTRKTLTIEGYQYPLDLLIEYAIDVLDINSITLVSQGEPRDYRRKTCSKSNPVYKWFTEQSWK